MNRTLIIQGIKNVIHYKKQHSSRSPKFTNYFKHRKLLPKLNEKSKEPMQYAGFYRISSITSNALSGNAFISLGGIYTVKSSETEYKIEIGISTDGVSSRLIIVDSTMTFSNNTLTVPTYNLNTGEIIISFYRSYVADGNFGSLVSISGTIGDSPFTGNTPLNLL